MTERGPRPEMTLRAEYTGMPEERARSVTRGAEGGIRRERATGEEYVSMPVERTQGYSRNPESTHIRDRPTGPDRYQQDTGRFPQWWESEEGYTTDGKKDHPTLVGACMETSERSSSSQWWEMEQGPSREGETESSLYSQRGQARELVQEEGL